jgi:hypothetical protein
MKRKVAKAPRKSSIKSGKTLTASTGGARKLEAVTPVSGASQPATPAPITAKAATSVPQAVKAPTRVRKTAKVPVPVPTTPKAATAVARTAKAATPVATAAKVTAPAPSMAKAAAPAPMTSKVPTPVPKAAQRERAPDALLLNIPPILLEGDAPATPTVSGPGRRYVLAPTTIAAPAASASAELPGELPESYDTRQLFLAARDPHWLYAYWDFSREQINKYNALSADGHLLLRIYRGAVEGEPISQIHLHPESRSWFAPVPAAGAKYLAELGYRDAGHKWVSLVRSGPTFSPPDSLSDDTSILFATIPADVSFAELLALVKGAVREHVPLVETMQQMRAQGYRELPTPETVQSEWTPAQEKALAAVISIDRARRVWIGSLEITELIRRQVHQQVSSISAAQLAATSSLTAALGAVSSVSRPFGGAERGRGFWFNVNAELVIYGATEPDAKVTLGERPIKLRPDGSFSFRFALPDGEYSLPVAAQSADGVETRKAHLKFSRGTAYHGDVRPHPQDEKLKPPLINALG